MQNFCKKNSLKLILSGVNEATKKQITLLDQKKSLFGLHKLMTNTCLRSSVIATKNVPQTCNSLEKWLETYQMKLALNALKSSLLALKIRGYSSSIITLCQVVFESKVSWYSPNKVVSITVTSTTVRSTRLFLPEFSMNSRFFKSAKSKLPFWRMCAFNVRDSLQLESHPSVFLEITEC